MTNTTRPPRQLSEESTKLWPSVLADYKLEQRHEAVLLAALEALDRRRQAQAQLEADGLTTTDRYGGVKAQPCVVIERDSLAAEGGCVTHDSPARPQRTEDGDSPVAG